jgi:hypothetical protein
MVGATGSNQTAKARSTAQAFAFNASTNTLSVANLGVGVDNPSYKLQVGNGGGSPHIFVSGNYNSSAASDHSRIYFNDANFGIGVGNWGSTNDDDLYLWAYNGTGRDIRFCSTTDGSTAVTNAAWTTNMIIKNNGDVGINTTNPLEKLHVRGNFLLAADGTTSTHITQKPYTINNGTLSWEGSAGQLFSITNNLTSGSIFSVNDVSGIPSIDVDANGTILFAPYGGNIGVGTLTPAYKFHVSGTSYLNGATYITGPLGVNNTNPTTTLDVDGAITARLTGDSGGYRLHVNSGIVASGNLMRFFSGQSSGFSFNANSDGSNSGQIVSIDTSGNITAVGTVQGTRLISTVATGTAPLTVSSTDLVSNLNADLLDGYNTGTSGNVIPLLDGANTWSGTQTFSGAASAPFRLVATNADANFDAITFQATNEWGDSNNYGVLGGDGSEGFMLRRPHVVWNSGHASADIRLGRSGGTSGGAWVNVGVKSSNVGFIGYEDTNVLTWGLNGVTFPTQIISTRANNTSTGEGQIYLNGATGNRIDFNSIGVAGPTFTTRSAGTKIVLFPELGASAVDYALGIDGSTLWYSVPQGTSTYAHRWYAGTTNIATLDGVGTLTISKARIKDGNLPYGGDSGVYDDSRMTLAVGGPSLDSIVYQSQYNNGTYPDYGLVFIHGASGGDRNVWSISPEGPAKGNKLGFLYDINSTNIHVGTYRFWLDGSGNSYSQTSSRAPRFYDSDNTEYYFDGGGTRIASLRIFTNSAASHDAIEIYTDGQNGYIQGLGDEVGLRIRSQYGNVLLADDRGNVGVGIVTPTYKLHVNGSFGATTKSFIVNHPTKEGKKLQYGSLESPYHGIRLTGKGMIENGECVVELPEYIGAFVKEEGINIHTTNIKHGQVLWVENVDVEHNKFMIKCEEISRTYEFYWDFTAIRKDVPDLEVEI